MHEPTFLLLTALTRGPLYGYAIAQAVDELSDGRVRLKPGTLYTALDRLVGEGLIEVDREEVVDGRVRRHHRITAAGVAALAGETQRWKRNTERAARALRAHGTSAAGA